MNRIQIIILYVFCIGLVVWVDWQDISSVENLFSMGLVDVFFLAFWAGIFTLLMLPVLWTLRKARAALKKN